ncbi:uncharacterized protein N7498_004423 [Penicillium cinerascens]|uniref:Uncharacterized protein n=1 Tax=Penicillium cinerascens TaxID=70096 RepID=A0A9W9T7U7_9EURO|nr:uncharacterized protein N7498_004423 [Penicillium cinerascens]KAJ5212777.1 hypothetical protein N7498_004423 [Penicillium cinerascens]
MADLAVLDPALFKDNNLESAEVSEMAFACLRTQIFSLAECDRIMLGPDESDDNTESPMTAQKFIECYSRINVYKTHGFSSQWDAYSW